jgi:hypothetical protein
MTQAFAIWFLIGLALVTANLPFVLKRPMLALPWTQAGEPQRPAWWKLLESVIFFAALTALAYGGYRALAGAFFMASDAASVAVFVVKFLAIVGIAVALLAYPGWRNRGRLADKSFFSSLHGQSVPQTVGILRNHLEPLPCPGLSRIRFSFPHAPPQAR